MTSSNRNLPKLKAKYECPKTPKQNFVAEYNSIEYNQVISREVIM